MATPFYSRYIPPKPKAAPSTQSPNAASREDASKTSLSPTKDAVANVKKRKRPHHAENDTLPNAESQLKERSISQEGDSIGEHSAPPVRKPSKAKRKPASDTQEHQDDNEPADQAKYAAIFAKYQKASQQTKARGSAEGASDQINGAAQQPTVVKQGLVPIPQPVAYEQDQEQPTFSALPSWLSSPIVSLPTKARPFTDYNISPKILENITKKNFLEALAIQSTLLPLLLSGPEQHPGDVCISAPTGSGKTLGYLLPLIEHVKEKLVTQLRGLVIVPTRELVGQAKEVAEACAVGTGLHIGTALGNVSVETERKNLVHKGQAYNPEAAAVLMRKAQEIITDGLRDDDHILDDLTGLLPDHVPEYSSNVDILICTPGRLVEHIQTTRGFSLDRVEWVIIDEADQLLDQSFQEWISVLLDTLHQRPKTLREKLLTERWHPPRPALVKKIILSATMTQDLSKLTSLRLHKPILVCTADETRNLTETSHHMSTDGERFILPSTLTEFAVPVGDGGDKPIHLLELLKEHIRISPTKATGKALKPSLKNTHVGESASDAESSDTSSTSDTSDSDTSDSDTSDSETSESDLSSDESSISPNSRNGILHANAGKPKYGAADSTGTTTATGSTAAPVKVLIFTNDNENAVRLSHLLKTVYPPFEKLVATITKSSASSESRKTLRHFTSGSTPILVASDRASRGLDIPLLDHVVNYDMPRNLQNYIHRVGRTARAGQPGTSWTFIAGNEAKWFWNSIGKSAAISRTSSKVKRYQVDIPGGEARASYEAALKSLQDAVHGVPPTTIYSERAHSAA